MNNAEQSKDEETFEYPVWLKRGIMLVRRDCLPLDDPESVPNLWIKKFGNLNGFPFDEFMPEDSRKKQMLMARTLDTDVLRFELNQRIKYEEGI